MTHLFICCLAPGPTQQLLDRSLRQKNVSRSIICGGGKDRSASIGEKLKATALYMAAAHLPTPLINSPGERAGMLLEAVKSLEKIGDQKRLQECYHLLKTFESGNVCN